MLYPLLLDQLNIENKQAYGFLQTLIHISHLPIPIIVIEALYAELDPESDKMTYQKSLDLLVKSQFISMDDENLISVKEELQSILSKQQNHQLKKESLSFLMLAINSLFTTKIEFIIPFIVQHTTLLPLIEHVITLNTQEVKEKDCFLKLLLIVLQYYNAGLRDFKKASFYITLFESYNENHVTPTEVLIGFYLMKAAYLDWNDASYQEAIEVALEAFHLAEQEPYSLLEEKLMICNRLSQQYEFIGDIDQAYFYSNKGAEIIRESKESVGNLDAYYLSRARIYSEKDKWDKTEYYSELSLLHLKKDCPYASAIPIYFYQIVILLHKNLFEKAYQDALLLLQKAKENLSDKKHPIIGNIYRVLAEAALRLHKINEAQEYITKAYNFILPRNIRSLLKAHLIHSEIMMFQGKYKEAYNKLQETKMWSESMFKKKQIQDLNQLTMLIDKVKSKF